MGFFGISKHVEGKLLDSWHLQHVGGDIGVFRHVGGVEELMAPPDVLWWVFWRPGISIHVGSGGLTGSQHLQVCLGEALG